MNENEEFEFALALEKEREAKSGVVGQAWDALKIPEEKSREGLKMIAAREPSFSGQIPGALAAIPLTAFMGPGAPVAGAILGEKMAPSTDVPSGNLLKNLVTGAPKVAAETMAEVAPGFVSRGSILGSAALKTLGATAKMAKPAAKWLGKTLEGGSGLENVPVKTPGLLTEAFENPTLMLKPGTAAANEMYSTVQKGGEQIGRTLTETPEKLKFVKRALKLAAQNGLGTDEALAARQELDGIKDSVTRAFYSAARKSLDAIAKQDYSGADAAYVQGMKADALRSFSAINKNGTPSAGRGFAMFLKPWTIPYYSPLVQAMGASTLGAVAKGGNAVKNTGAAVPGIANIIERELDGKRKRR